MAPSLVADHPVSSLRKLMAMLPSGRASFKREFLEINAIERYHNMHTVRASPTNERILLANPLQSSKSIFSRKSFPSFCACKEGMWGTHISAFLSSPTVSARILFQPQSAENYASHRPSLKA